MDKYEEDAEINQWIKAHMFRLRREFSDEERWTKGAAIYRLWEVLRRKQISTYLIWSDVLSILQKERAEWQDAEIVLEAELLPILSDARDGHTERAFRELAVRFPEVNHERGYPSSFREGWDVEGLAEWARNRMIAIFQMLDSLQQEVEQHVKA